MMTKSPTAVVCLSSGQGGMELYALKIARMLGPHLPVTLVFKAGSFLEQRARELNDADFRLWPIAFRSRVFSPATIVSMRRLLREHGIANVIFLGASELKSLAVAFLGKPINLIQRHATTKSKPKKDWLHRLVYRSVDHHVAISQHIARNVRHIIPVHDKASLNIIYPSFPLPAASTRSRSAGEPIELLHVGRLVPGKGQRDAVDACRILHENGITFRLRLVGDVENSGYAASLREHVDGLPYRDAIEFSGYHRNIKPFHESSDLFIYPSYGEGFGNAFNEAMTAGLIPVAYANTVFPELVELGFFIRLADDRNVASLADNLLTTCRQLEADWQRAQGNRELAETHYAPSTEREKWLALLR